MLRVHVEGAADAELSTTLDELVAEGARRMPTSAPCPMSAMNRTTGGYGKHSLREPLLALSVGHDLAINQNGERSRAKSAEPALPLRPDFDQMFANFLIPCALR
jgi:hypothetical protein